MNPSDCNAQTGRVEARTNMDEYEGIFVDDEDLDHVLIYTALDDESGGFDDESGCLGVVLFFIAILVF